MAIALLVLLMLWPQAGRAQSANDGFDPNASGAVLAMAVQTDGKILVAGDFGQLGGQARIRIGRLNVDGSLDTSFNPGADSPVRTLALQADGKILVGGEFSQLGGQARSRIGRLNLDGSLDASFDPGVSGFVVYAIVVQPDGKILVGGEFTQLAGQPRNCIGRLNSDGSLDTSFNPVAGGFPIVYALALQAEGKILVAGQLPSWADRPATTSAGSTPMAPWIPVSIQ